MTARPLPAACALALAAAAPSRAADLEVDPAIDIGVTAGLAAAWIASEILKPYLAPSSCRWCEPPGFEWDVRRVLVAGDTAAAAAASDMLAFALIPAVSLGVGAAAARDAGGERAAWETALLVSESAAVAAALNQTVKLLTGRRRPYVHAVAEDGGAVAHDDPDGNLSFYSGHTTLAFSLAVSSATIATIRGRDAAPYLWVTGLILATATGILRMAADRHYLLDVAVGAAAGALAGWVVPWLHLHDS